MKPSVVPLVMPKVHASRVRVWRGFVVGAVLLPPNAWWVFYLESISGKGPYVSTVSLFFNVVFIMAALGLANAALRRIRPWLALNRAELIIVYVMLTIGTSVAGLDMLQVLLPIMTTGAWRVDQLGWGQMLSSTTPEWLLITDKQVLYDYWIGNSTLYRAAVLDVWLYPALFWTGFLVVLTFVMLCLTVVLRPLWADRERLTFPIIQLPLELTDPGTPLLRNRLMWVGFGAAGMLDLINGLSAMYPSVPHIPVRIELAKIIHDMPWAGIGWLPLYLTPSIIGLSFLMPLDLLFSCVAFFFWWKLLFIIAAATGTSQGYTGDMSSGVFPWKNEQMFGGFIAVALTSPLIGRRYFRHVWYRIVGKPSEVNDSGEGMSFRATAFGAVLGVIALIGLSAGAGMSPGIAIAFFVTYFLLAVAVARVRAEFGSPVHDFHASGPDYTLTRLLGSANLRAHDLGAFTQYFWFNRAYRGHLIADAIEGIQMRARTHTPARAMLAAIIAATALAALAGFWVWLHLAYREGAASFVNADYFGWEAYSRLQQWLQDPQGVSLVTILGVGGGFAVTLALASARSALAAWPLHPVAYALSASWSMHLMWGPMLIAWIAKSLVLRYGGLRLYRDAVPLFYGLIFGESIVGCAGSLVGAILSVPSYNFFG